MTEMRKRGQIVGGLLLLAMAWHVWTPVPHAVAATPMRTVILFDISGSMRQNDPYRLSRTAARLFLDLARPQDQVGLVAFSDNPVPLLPLTTMSSPAAKTPFLGLFRVLRFDGQTTDLGAALESGLASFPLRTTTGNRDMALLLTDGKLDLGRRRRAQEPVILQQIRETLLPQYRERGIVLYTIAFTENADRALLQEIAHATGGEFRFIESAPMLHKAFSDMFVLVKQAESIPMSDGQVLIDPSIQEASLVLSKPDPREPIGLVTPQQKHLDAHSNHPGVRWNTTPSYDMVQLTQPAPGTWRVERQSGGGEDIAIIGASTLSLEVVLTPMYLEVGEPLTIQAHLLDHGQPMRDLKQLQGLTVRAEFTTPEGETSIMPLQARDSGEYVATLRTPEASGQYGLVVTAASPVLQRQRMISFIPQPVCFEPAVVADPQVTVRVSLTRDCSVFQQLDLEAGYIAKDEPKQVVLPWFPLEAFEAGTFKAELPRPTTATEASVMVRIRGRLEDQQPMTIMKGPISLPELPIAWEALAKTVGSQLLLVNMVLGIFGGSGYGVYRRYIRHRSASHA
jgi:hypothetical protein